MAKKTVLFMAGGTGGHVFPALAVARFLEKQGYNIAWLGTKKGIEYTVMQQEKIPLTTLSIWGIRKKGILTKLFAPFRVMYATLQAMLAIIKIKPVCVIGMGGFASGPGGIAAWLLRKPLIVHEQNTVAGVTNKILARFATKLCQAFDNTFTPNLSPLLTGNPVRENISNLFENKKTNESNKNLNLLVLGGTLGAAAINENMEKALPELLKIKNLNIKHQVGKNNFKPMQSAAKAYGNAYEVLPFIEDMAKAYAWADMVIARAGALTVAELAIAGLPAILIPYPHAVDDHQAKNAQFLADKGAATVILQKELTPQKITDVIKNWATNSKNRQHMTKMSKAAALPQATEAVATVCLEVINNVT